MKKFETPAIELVRISVEDVITTSNGGNTDTGAGGLPDVNIFG